MRSRGRGSKKKIYGHHNWKLPKWLGFGNRHYKLTVAAFKSNQKARFARFEHVESCRTLRSLGRSSSRKEQISLPQTFLFDFFTSFPRFFICGTLRLCFLFKYRIVMTRNLFADLEIHCHEPLKVESECFVMLFENCAFLATVEECTYVLSLRSTLQGVARRMVGEKFLLTHL